MISPRMGEVPETSPPPASPAEVVKRVRAGSDDGLLRDVAARKAQLRQLRRLLVEQEDRLLDALAADLGKSRVEGWATDVGFTATEIAGLTSHVERWARPRRVSVPLPTRPAKAWVVPEPRGVALVIGLIHLMNLWTLNAFRRRAVQRHQTERAAQAWSAPSGGWPPPATGPAGA